MSTLNRTQLRELAEPGKGPCLSIFVAASPPVSNPRSDRLNKLVRRGEQDLKSQGVPTEVVEQIVRPIRDIGLRKPSWHTEQEGAAVFSSPGFFRHYAVDSDVPEIAVASNRFHLSPLFSAVEAQRRYCLLALSQKGVRLYRGDSTALAATGDDELPKSPLAPDLDVPGERRSGLLHLHHAHHERRKQMLLTYFRSVDEVLRTRLGVNGEPIVLAGVGYLCAIYRHASALCVAGEIHCDAFQICDEELRQRGWEMASRYFQSVRARVADEFYQLWHTSRVSNDIRDIVAAARYGRIEALFVGVDHRKTSSDADLDTLNAVAIDAFISGGTVYGVSSEEVPGRGPAAAIFRY